MLASSTMRGATVVMTLSVRATIRAVAKYVPGAKSSIDQNAPATISEKAGGKRCQPSCRHPDGTRSLRKLTRSNFVEPFASILRAVHFAHPEERVK
jgi:hypothetical protein